MSLKNHKDMILYGLILAVGIIILRSLELHFMLIHYQFEIYAGLIAILFMILGIWLALKLTKSKTDIIITEKPKLVKNESAAQQFRLSAREIEVLQLMAQGKSNQEFADDLFVSLNTIKTHNRKLFEKMEVKRRTQAIEIGKKLAIIS